MTAPASDMRIRGEAAAAALHREMRVRWGCVEPISGPRLYDAHGFVLASDRFQFTTPAGNFMHYTRGEGIVAQPPGPGLEDEFQLYLWGTVFGAVAWLNGYFALHAGAVVRDGRAIAFTGDSGAGKSTLCAALAARGFAHLCDDTLVLVASIDHAPGAIIALPDRKPAKLWDDAFALVGAERGSDIISVPGKAYAHPAGSAASPAPLTDLYLLEESDAVRCTPVRGRDRVAALAGAMYRDFVPAAIGNSEDYGQTLMAIASAVKVWRLGRPRSATRQDFDRTTAEIAAIVARR